MTTLDDIQNDIKDENRMICKEQLEKEYPECSECDGYYKCWEDDDGEGI